eukprot:Gb_06906 [translate_table: standard]
MSSLSLWPLWSLVIMQVCVHAQDMQQQFSSPHKEAKSEVGMCPLQWNDTLAVYAHNYANQRCGDCDLIQSSGSQYEKNTFADVVNGWVGEKQYYDYSSSTCAQARECRHYTQVVWKNSVKLGCALLFVATVAILLLATTIPDLETNRIHHD